MGFEQGCAVTTLVFEEDSSGHVEDETWRGCGVGLQATSRARLTTDARLLKRFQRSMLLFS